MKTKSFILVAGMLAFAGLAQAEEAKPKPKKEPKPEKSKGPNPEDVGP